MKKNTNLFLLAVIFCFSTYLVSCKKENNVSSNASGEITLSVDILKLSLNNTKLKSALDSALEGYKINDAKKIVITIENMDGSPTKYTSSELAILQMNGSYYSQKIALKVGYYKLTEFDLVNANGNTIFAAPLTGSLEAQNVSNPLPLIFEVTKDTVTPIDIEVLSTENLTPEDFGLIRFQFTSINIFSFLIAVADEQQDSLLSATINIRSDSYNYTQNLDKIANNIVTIKDGFLNYKVVVQKQGYKFYTYTFTLDSLKTYEVKAGNLPLVVELKKNGLVILSGPQDIDDAMIEYYPDGIYPDRNFGDYIAFPAIAWTAGGIPLVVRSAMKFNLDQIPVGTTIKKATLALYAVNTSTSDSPGHGNGHSTLSGENSGVLMPITDPWDEHTITWNNQPSTTTTNQVELHASTNDFEDYKKIDITAMVQEMINEPSANYGFMIKLNNENYYRRLLFGSSDNPDVTKRPKITIEY